MRKKLLTFALIGLLASCGGGGESSEKSSEPQALETSFVTPSTKQITPYAGKDSNGACYEIFVYSFADSNGDGIGDLKGIEGKLDYLQELGIETIWLTPVHPSSTYHKYNVKDYYDIDPKFGTVDDFVSLCASAKTRGIRVIMDMVFNHSSLDNPWFKQAATDFLYGKTGPDSLADLYVFGLEAEDVPNTKATYDVDGTPIYYECNFDRSMPEFKCDGELARAKHKDIMSYWIGKGASGFRFDGAAYYYFGDAAKNMSYISYLSQTAKEIKSDVYLIAEYWLNGQVQLNPVAENGMNVFNFATSTSGVTTNPVFAIRAQEGYDYADAVEKAVSGIYNASKGAIAPSIFISNHDQDRFANSSTSDAQLGAMAALYLLTPGTPYLYYGEEIAMQGYRMTAQTDVNRRLPMQWKADASSDTARTKRAPGGDYNGDQTTLGALDAIKDPKSITSRYKEILALRKSIPAIRNGIFRSVTEEDAPIAAFQITYEGKTTYLVHNVVKEPVKVTVPSGLKVANTVGEAAALEGTTLTLPAYASAYLAMEN